MIRLRTGHHYNALHTHNHQCLNNHDETTMTNRVKSKTFILNNSQNQSNLRPTRNPKWPTYSLQKDYFLNPMCWTDFSKSNTRHLIQDRTCHACVSSKQREKMVNLLLVIQFNLNPIWIQLTVRPNSSKRTIETSLNPKNNNTWISENARYCTQTHVRWMNEHAEEDNRDSCAHLVVWKDTGPVRGCGPVRSSDGEPARDEGSRWIRLIQTGRTGVWIMFGLRVCAGCCQDRDQLNPPSERRQPLLGHSTPPSSLLSDVRFAKESFFWKDLIQLNRFAAAL